MTRLNYKYVLVLILFPILSNCDDIFEEDISNDEVRLVSPLNNAELEGNFVQFQWQTLEDATKYRIQVSDENQQIIKDTLLLGNQYIFPIDSGSYHWRVRGENFAYNTAYSLNRSFSIMSNDDLSNQMIFLQNPIDNYYSTTQNILLQWMPNEFADNYTLEIEKTLDGITTNVLFESLLTETTYNIDASLIGEDASYIWKIKGINSGSETGSSSRIFYIDNEIPGIAALLTPNIDFSAPISNTIEFSWELPDDTGEIMSEVKSVLEISNNLDFTDIYQSFQTDEEAHSFIFTGTGFYYWRVRLIDIAGNFGMNSEVRELTIQ